MAQEAVDTIRGVEKYRNPSTGEVAEIPQESTGAWHRNGEVIHSTQQGYNPNDPDMNPDDWGGWEEIEEAE